jgi:hypothetical protein
MTPRRTFSHESTIIIVLLALFCVDSAGAEDTLTVILPYFTIKMPDFYEGEEGITPSGSDSLYTDISDIKDNSRLNYSLWDFLGPYGDVFDADLYIISDNTDFRISRIEQQYTTDIRFNEDGSGGVWSISGLENTTSEWMLIHKVDDGHYVTLGEGELAEVKPALSEATINEAETYIGSRQIPTTYDEYVANVGIRIIWSVDSDTFETLLNFDYEYGD